MQRVRGVFRDRAAVARAVRRLAQKSVPSDAIEVAVLDARGEPVRRVPVEDESGALRGAVIGGLAGAALGVVLVTLALSGAFGPVPVDPLGWRSLSGALRAILMASVAAVPLGALLGMGHWRGRKKIELEEIETGSVAVVVESNELAPVARQVLRESGADQVTG